MANKYVDVAAITQVIGCIYNDSSILDQENYSIIEEDFTEEFHKIVFGSIYNIYHSDSKVTLDAIIDYLAVRPKYDAVFKVNKGIEYLTRASELATKDTFNYYYNRMKKFTLLREYDKIGVDVSFLYDPDNILDTKKKQKQEDWLDNSTLLDISLAIDTKIEDIKNKYVDDSGISHYQAGDSIVELIEELEIHPEIGIPMYGPLINTITRGARLGKLFIRSAGTGIGKTRALIADICNFACDEIYHEDFGWIKNGKAFPSLFIATEQDKSEIQTLMLAFLANVNEDHILDGRYEDDERDRVIHAAEILKRSPLWIETIPDFSLLDIENIIKKNIREHDVMYVAF